jgi:hypothetical protein
MDSEAAVIRSEMSQTRAELDRKISELGERAHEFTPRAVAKRYLPENALDYTIGGVLTLIGTRMAWGRYSSERHRREQLRATLAASGSW